MNAARPDVLHALIEDALAEQARGTQLPFVIVARATATIAGMTRVLDIHHTAAHVPVFQRRDLSYSHRSMQSQPNQSPIESNACRTRAVSVFRSPTGDASLRSIPCRPSLSPVRAGLRVIKRAVIRCTVVDRRRCYFALGCTLPSHWAQW